MMVGCTGLLSSSCVGIAGIHAGMKWTSGPWVMRRMQFLGYVQVLCLCLSDTIIPEPQEEKQIFSSVFLSNDHVVQLEKAAQCESRKICIK